MELPENPSLSIVIPCRNEANFIDACLTSVLAQEGLPADCEVLVADGMSDDGTRERIVKISNRDPRVQLVDNLQRVVSAGLNLAIRMASGEVVIRMDAHTEYASDYIQQCLGALRESGAENVGGPARTRAEGRLENAIVAAYHSPFSVGGAKFHDPGYEGDVDTVVYGCWRKSTLMRIGLFDEELVRNQDDELNYRLIRSGGRIWQTPRIRSWYRPRSSLSALFRQYLQYGYWKVRVVQKHGRPASFRHLVPILFVLGLAFGWMLGFVHPGFWWLYLVAILAYAVLSVCFSVKAASRHGWNSLPLLPLVFLIYHVSYGLGFGWGILDFVLLRRRATTAMTRLSRPSVQVIAQPCPVPGSAEEAM